MRGLILSAAVAAAALAGCYTTGEVGYSATYSGGAYATSPDLVEVSPGVQVVADYDEPVFYTDGFYWRYYNNGWYRSNNYATGWFYVDAPPVVISRIDRPYAYTHYRPRGYVSRRTARYRAPEPIARDRRTYAPPAARPPAYAPQGTSVRDHRTYAPPPAAAPPGAVVRDRRSPPPAAAPPPAARAPVRDHRAPPPAENDDNTRDHRHH
jgi:hypothetical protein